MPRIPDFLLDSVIYLYSSQQYAEKGERAGGTGFLVSIPASVAGAPDALYAVTNSHVINKGFPVIRLNNRRDAMDILPLTAAQWKHHRDGDDIAVCPIGLQPEHHRFFALDRTKWFMTEEELTTNGIGPGDEVFFLGRYVSHEGRQKNLPTARFGTISMLPYEQILDANGHLVDAFLIEARSLSGYSGSPVFLYILSHTLRDMEWSDSEGPHHAARETRQAMISLLGIDLGHHPIFKQVLEEKQSRKRPVSPPRWVEQNSGMMRVTPTWKLSDLLDEPELADMRHEQEQNWVREQR